MASSSKDTAIELSIVTPLSVQVSDTEHKDPGDVPNGQSPQTSDQKTRPKAFCSPKVNYSEFSVHIVTWNIASTEPSSADIESLFLPQEGAMMHNLYNETDIIVVGLQEAYQSAGGVVTSNLPLVGQDPLVESFGEFLAQKGFARLSSSRLLGILTMVFIKRPLLCYISNLETATFKTGFSGLLGNKGSSSIRFTLGDLSICFTNCHLFPHPENNERRTMELRDILEKGEFSAPPTQLLEHDVVVLFGDLNFRLEGVEFHDAVTALHTTSNYTELLKLDQLIREQSKGSRKSLCQLYSFMERGIDFQPSYKYKPGTDCYDDGGKGRAPAWTDRVLWRTHIRRLPKITDAEPRAVLNSLHYSLHMQPRTSDHKAVSKGLKLSVDISDYTPQVIFRLNEWTVMEDGLISFDVIAGTQISMFDWIGLYLYDFSSVERDYLYYTYTPARGGETEDRVYRKVVPAAQVPDTPGKYVLVYKSYHYGRVLGMSPVFRITARLGT